MKVYEGKDIRNVGVVGHGHCGKTMLTSALLYTAGAVNRLTRPDEGNTVTDFDEEEIQRKFTISTAIAAAEWKKTKTQSPRYSRLQYLHSGHARFPASRPTAALIVVDGVAGVEVQTEKVYSFAEEFHLPHAFFINKLDRERADFERALDNIHEIFGRIVRSDSAPDRQREELHRHHRSDLDEGVHLHAERRRQGQRRSDPRRHGARPRKQRMKRWSRSSPKAKTS